MRQSEMTKLGDFIFSKLIETKLPGLTVSIVEEGKVIYARGFGFKNVERAAPTTIQTNYGIGSVSKSFTALAISKLVEDGKLDFHDRVTDLIPSLRGRGLEQVEIHHLLTHTSGIPGLGWAEALIFNATKQSRSWLPVASSDDMASFFDGVSAWREAPPGTKYFYLNEGYFLLGEVISKVSGKSYAQYVRDNILVPLKMNRTFFSREEVEADGNFAVPYLIKDGIARSSSVPWQSQPSAGGIMSNVSDFSNYIMMYLGRGEFAGIRIADERTIEGMWTPYSHPPKRIFPDLSYGYGFFVTRQFFGERLVYHGGSVSVYTSGMALLPDRGIGFSVLANGEGYDPVLLCLYGLSLMLGKDPELDLPPIRRENLLRRLEGTYRTYKGLLSARVTRSGDFLILSGEDVGSYILVPEEGSELQEDVATFFTLSETARMVVQFRFSANGTEMIFERYRYRKE
ncbi:MAG: serine hydrolase [Thermoplasmata archaeon]